MEKKATTPKKTFKVSDRIKPFDQYPKLAELVGKSFDIVGVTYGVGRFGSAVMKIDDGDGVREFLTSSEVVVDQLMQFKDVFESGGVLHVDELKANESGKNVYYSLV